MAAEEEAERFDAEADLTPHDTTAVLPNKPTLLKLRRFRLLTKRGHPARPLLRRPRGVPPPSVAAQVKKARSILNWKLIMIK